MQYRAFGQTGMSISRLGFGAMRLPQEQRADGSSGVAVEQSIALFHRAFELGLNYVDTALFYCGGESEIVVGQALKGWRERVYLSTKFPVRREQGYRATLEEQLRKLDVEYLDCYHFHGIGQWFLNHEQLDEMLAAATQAKAEGLIRHISFSFHDKPEVMAKIIDLGVFSSVLCQYNLLDRANEPALADAKARGLGTVVMGPVGGGRIAGLPPELAAQLGIPVRSSAELALRFVMANPNVDCALSGMNALSQIEENCATADTAGPLSPAEVEAVNAAMEENKRLADLYCTGCDYCLPHCPNEVNISRIFGAMNSHRVYGLTGHAKHLYDSIGRGNVKGAKADACVECGECEEHCPQQIPIREQLRDCRELFESLA
ncbi:MAG: aldo/keto reductase [Fimbriimonadaceae bacterium]|nr:aldo/keto reductase [Fimbriimonadaceae bacterium]